jgi:hypothetical protein
MSANHNAVLEDLVKEALEYIDQGVAYDIDCCDALQINEDFKAVIEKIRALVN